MDSEFNFNNEQIEIANKLVKEGRREVPNFYDEGESEIIYVPVEHGEIRVFHHKPEKILTKRPILFAPGFSTTPWAWREFHYSHHNFAEFYHLETREKTSSKIKRNRKNDFTINRISLDIADAIDYLALNKQDYILYGASFGGGVVLNGLINKNFNPPTTVVFDPLCVWRFAKFWVNFVLPILPAPVLGGMRFIFAKIIMGGMKNQIQKQRNMDFIKGADPYKWRKSCLSNRKLNLENKFTEIENEVFIFHGPKDKFHPGMTFYNYAKAIPQGRFFYINTTEENRELLAGIIGTAFMEVTKEQGLPKIFEQFEVKLE